MYLAEADLAPELELNEILWKSVRGAASPMPPPVRSAFIRAFPMTMTTMMKKTTTTPDPRRLGVVDFNGRAARRRRGSHPSTKKQPTG